MCLPLAPSDSDWMYEQEKHDCKVDVDQYVMDAMYVPITDLSVFSWF